MFPDGDRFVVRTVSGWLGFNARCEEGLSALVIDTGYMRQVACFRSEDRPPARPQPELGDPDYGTVCPGCGGAKAHNGHLCRRCAMRAGVYAQLGKEGALRLAEEKARELNEWDARQEPEPLGPLGSLLERA